MYGYAPWGKAECSVRKTVRLFLLTIGLVGVGHVQAWDILNSNLYVTCQQENTQSLNCDYRMLIPEPPLGIRAHTNETNLVITGRETYPWRGAVTAVLILVDTSDPGRQNVVENNIGQISELVESSEPHHKLGLANFDKGLVIKAPIGADKAILLESLHDLRATGKTTELYRSVMKAIEVLAGIDANRKSIFLFSDGQAEDKAYYHADVIAAARRAQVIINSFGFPRSSALSVALQTLRRLSEETGGTYIESDNQFNLPERYAQTAYENLDNGGKFTIDLKSAPDNLLRSNPAVTINFATDIGDLVIEAPVNQPRLESTQVATPAGILPTPAPNAGVQPAYTIVAAPPAETGGADWLWYVIPVILLILLILMIVILVVIFQENKNIKNIQVKTSTSYKPFAYLVVQDEKATRYPITNTIWRIGRTRDNELTLNDASVSRRHAEIQRSGNGVFSIFDVESTNGLYINGEKIKKKKLQEGDILEIGDIFLRFTLYSADYTLDEDTAIQHTRAPAVTG